MEEINGREFGRIHIPGDGDYTDGKSLPSSERIDFWGNGR